MAENENHKHHCRWIRFSNLLRTESLQTSRFITKSPDRTDTNTNDPIDRKQ